MQAAAWLLFITSVVFRLRIPLVHFEVLAVLYLYLILSVTINPRPLITLEQPFFNRTGTISYGLYMYHYPLVPLLILMLQKVNLWNTFTQFHQLPLVLLSFAATYGIATLSYRYFEGPILKLKPVPHQTPLNVTPNTKTIFVGNNSFNRQNIKQQ